MPTVVLLLPCGYSESMRMRASSYSGTYVVVKGQRDHTNNIVLNHDYPMHPIFMRIQ